jgi:hypothetical protein
MANCIAICTGIDNSRQKEDRRLGAYAAQAQANTWRTFTTCYVNKDGSGYVIVSRNGETLHKYEFGPEDGG